MYISSLSRTGRGQTKVEMGLGSETQGGKSEFITIFKIKHITTIFNNNLKVWNWVLSFYVSNSELKSEFGCWYVFVE